MRAVIRLIVITALRDRLFSGLAGLVLLTFGLSLFLGSAALIEQREAGMVYAAGTSRLVVILGLVVFIAFQTQRLFESRELEAILSRSLSRPSFVFAYWAGFAVIATALVVPIAAAVLILYGLSSSSAAWSVSLLLECFVVLAFAQFAALTLERATTTIFVTLAFYAFTRLIGFLLGIREATPDTGLNRYANPIFDGLGMVIPRLDLMTQSEWLVYGFQQVADVPLVLLQSLVFIMLALCASAFDLQRKEF
jgi:hypothetical protein